jgi:hypothetical protein
MPNTYISHKPGELITAEDWNAMQGLIKQDIGNQIKKAVGEIKKVDQAGDAGTLDGKTLKEIEDEILNKAFEQLPKRSGYQMIFKVLEVDVEKVIEHKLKACPLVDVYQLDYFKVVCSADDQKSIDWVNFYLYHTSEKKIKFAGPPVETIVIESTDGKNHAYKIPFSDMLYRYDVQYTDDSSLSDVVNEFWKKFFSGPNDEFDEEQFCHSPWFDRCCCVEETSVGDIKKKGEWDDLWFQMRPKKTINYPLTDIGQPAPVAGPPAATGFQFPHNIQVSHFDFDTLGIRLLSLPVYPNPPFLLENGPINVKQEKVMLLLKV